MEERLLAKRPRLPSYHPGGGDGDPVNASRLVRDVTPDRLKALTPKELTLSTDVGLALEAIGLGTVSSFFLEDRTSDSEAGVFVEPAQEKFEEIPVERDVGIEVAHNLMIEGLDRLVTYIEGMCLGGEAAISAFRHVDHFDPLVKCRVTTDNSHRAVRRTVVHDHPSDRENGLVDYRLNGPFDEGLFVASRSDQDAPQRIHVAWPCAHSVQ